MNRLSALTTRWALALGLAAAACGQPTKPAVTAGSGSAGGSAAGSGSDVGSGSATPPAPAGPEQVSVTLADVGLEADSLDRSADPCSDFYQFACGGWMAKNQVPADRARWARFSQVEERNTATLHSILDEAALGKSTDPVMNKLGAFYGSCMNEAAVEKAGLKGIKPLQALIAKVRNPKTLEAAIFAFQDHGIPAGFGHWVTADLKDSTVNTLYVDSGGLGLPDRDYYLKDDFKDKRAAYHDHLVRVFQLLGKRPAAAKTAADHVMALETELAKATKTRVERRDVPNMYHPTSMTDLAKLAPRLVWKQYLTGIGASDVKQVVLTTPTYMTALSGLMASQKPAVWRDYLTVRLIDATAGSLPKKFDDEHFALQKALTGVEQQKERWKRCVDATGRAMPEYLGQPFVAKVFPGDSKKFAAQLYAQIATEIGKDIDTLDWMTPETKKAAHDKLSKIQFLTGYPDKWKTYDFKVDPTNYAANALAARQFEDRREAGKAGKPYDRSEWEMPAFIVNAYYEPSANNSALPAGILQPPFFGADRAVAANFGGIGMVAGHELTHAFDDQGAQFDAEGRLQNWWQPSDLKAFKAKGECVAAQYSTFEPLPGKHVNGHLTMGENIADLGGVKMAFRAYRDLRAGAKKVYVADGFTEDQQFFLGAGQAWCDKDRPAEIERRLTVDPHSPPKFRVFGALRNTPAFAEAFHCAVGTPMHPKDTCSVW